ncbi:helix-turn-helix transcriptional regulator [Ottowia pentelensis]|uniref:Helix-turn-helix transcriptional regulator n=1 Tax=Ottowia pentelensis TaxID=511108 RepID=A0ABV6PVS5_9BURK
MSQVRTSSRPRQAAELLGISRATLWRWVATRHDFPRARRLSARCTVFDSAELIAWRDAQAKSTTAGG